MASRGDLTLEVWDRAEGGFVGPEGSLVSKAAVPADGATVGRSPDADLVLADCSEEAVSRIHFVLEPRVDRWMLLDRSTHGTVVRSHSAEIRLRDGEACAIEDRMRIILGGAVVLHARLKRSAVRGRPTGHGGPHPLLLPDDLRRTAVALVGAYAAGVNSSAALRARLAEELNVGERMVQNRLRKLIDHPAIAAHLEGDTADTLSKAAALYRAFPEFRPADGL